MNDIVSGRGDIEVEGGYITIYVRTFISYHSIEILNNLRQGNDDASERLLFDPLDCYATTTMLPQHSQR